MGFRRSQPTTIHRADVAGRWVDVSMTERAITALRSRSTPLVAEAELMFSCLVAKRLTFRDWSPDLLSWALAADLHVAVRPVRYELCLPEGGGTRPRIVDMPVADIAALVPSHVTIDHIDDEWTGTFRYDRS